MVSVLDTGPLVRPYNLEGKSINIVGVSFEALVPMLDRFPELRRVLTPTRGEVSVEDFTVESFIKMGPRIFGAIIAAGIGEAGSAEAEKAAQRLSIGHQVKILKEILDMTFPGGLGPFVQDLKAMGLLGRESEEGLHPSGGTGKVLGTNSQSPSANSFSSTVTREL